MKDQRMSKLLGIIDAYKDTHGQPSDASIARAIGSTPQGLSSWRTRGIRELPDVDTMQRLATFVGVPYRQVLEAALVDSGYMPASEPPRPVTPTDQGEGRRTG